MALYVAATFQTFSKSMISSRLLTRMNIRRYRDCLAIDHSVI